MTDKYLQTAEKRLRGEWRGTRYHYQAAETAEWYSVTKAEMRALGKALLAKVPDAYSHWCAGTASRVVTNRHKD